MNLSCCLCTRRLVLGRQCVYSAVKIIPDGYSRRLREVIGDAAMLVCCEVDVVSGLCGHEDVSTLSLKQFYAEVAR